MSTPTILCVDDELNVLLSLRTQLTRCFADFMIEIAESAEEALEVIEVLISNGAVLPLVIADQIMPNMNGDQFLIELHDRHPEILKVMLTGQASAEDVGNVVNRGNLYRFISKPWDENDLQLTVSSALQSYQKDRTIEAQYLALEQAKVELEILNADLEKQVQERTQQIQLNEARYRILTEVVAVGLFRFDAEGQCTYVNSRWCEMTGRPASEAMGMGWVETIHPDDIDQLLCDWKKAYQSDGHYQVESKFLRPDGSIVWFYGEVVPEFEHNGKIIGYIGSLTDISDRKQAEFAIHESSSKLIEAYAELDALFSAMTDVVLVRNAQGQCLKVAPTNLSCTLLGTPDEVIGKPIQEELPEQQAKIILSAISQALETKLTVNCDYNLRVKGRETWFSASISPIYPDTVIQISRDITERKHAEIALSIAKEEAEALAKAKSDFLANMSHEIRTPMNAVLGMTRLLSTTTLTTEQLEFVETILGSGDALLGIINDILDFSKIESGTLEIETQEFNLESILISTCNLLNNQALSKDISLSYTTQPDLPTSFLGDSSRLGQILLNIVGNAIKFADRGEVKISVEGHHLEDKYELHFQVSDSGIGIAGDRIPKLFQPFTQADASISRKYGGTGLGLAICKRLVNLMGGTVWLESFGQIGGYPPLGWSNSNITRGTSFYFTIALAICNQAIAHQNIFKSQVLALDQKLAEQFPLRILLAEDNPVNQKVACFTLKKLGYLVDLANNGLEVLSAVQNHTYDLVFMDLQMPEMDGLTATKLMRQMDPVYPWIVAVTANALPGDRQICLDAGMNDYISKPIDIHEIIRVLSSCDRTIEAIPPRYNP